MLRPIFLHKIVELLLLNLSLFDLLLFDLSLSLLIYFRQPAGRRDVFYYPSRWALMLDEGAMVGVELRDCWLRKLMEDRRRYSVAELVPFTIGIHSWVSKTSLFCKIVSIAARCLIFELLYPQLVYYLFEDTDLIIQLLLLLWFIICEYSWGSLGNLLAY